MKLNIALLAGDGIGPEVIDQAVNPVIFQYFLDDSGNFQNLDCFWTRSGPLHLIFITKILQKLQEKYGILFTNINFHIREYGILKVLEGMCT